MLEEILEVDGDSMHREGSTRRVPYKRALQTEKEVGRFAMALEGSLKFKTSYGLQTCLPKDMRAQVLILGHWDAKKHVTEYPLCIADRSYERSYNNTCPKYTCTQ